ncbi:MAG: glycosyltransferase family 9 protein [Panacibacter sp.]
MKFLIIRFSSIGDIVLTTPVIRCLKQQLPDAEVHYLTKKSYKGIIETNHYVDKLHILADDWGAMIASLKEEQFDVVIDLHHNLRTWRIKNALKKSQNFSFNKLNYEKWLLTAFKINKLPALHIVDRYLETVAAFGIKNDGKGLDYFIPEKDIVPITNLPASHMHGFIGVVIGAALNTKKLPVHKLQELCTKINHPVILLGGPEDKADGDDIAKADDIKVYNSCGKFNLNQSADLVRKAKLIITHDTGLMHIAAALQKRILSVWGNTVPGFGMGPYYGNAEIKNIIHEVENLSCRPCSKIGYKKCPKGHFKCMELQDIDAIHKHVTEL